MKKSPENPNDHKRVTPKTKGKERDDKKFTAYDTAQGQTDSPQKVRESQESAYQQSRRQKQK